jgi:putative photosynthetic complex assembly protein 2
VLQFGLPAIVGILVWWISTGLVLFLVWRPLAMRRLSMAVMTAVLPFALYALSASSSVTTTEAAYTGFAAALVLWAWHEMSFLLGIVTGPRTVACVKAARARAPLTAATETVIYHEFAIALTAALAVIVTWGEPNQCGTWTFIVLWLMRLSTKINIYLGVPNVTEDFLPKHLGYLKSYFCNRAMNPFFPVSVVVATGITVWLGSAALNANASDFEAVSYALLATFAGLGVIEHWFLVLPLPAANLWKWSLSANTTATETKVWNTRGPAALEATKTSAAAPL